MPPSEAPYTGGCQCGAVRFAVGRPGRGPSPLASLVSHPHPDLDTESWPPEGGFRK